MLFNHIIVAWRNFRKGKLISAINLAGLVMGVTFCLLILLWVQDERSVDAYHANSSRIFNVYEREFADGKVTHDYSTPGLLADELKKKVPEVEYAAVYSTNDESAMQVGEKSIKYNGLYANEDFLKVLSFPLIRGKVDEVLNDVSSIIISKKMADHFFGSAEKAIGQTVRFMDRDNFIVTGVFADVPDRSSLKFDYIINWHIFMEQNPWFKNFGNTAPFTTILLREGASADKVRAKIKDFLHAYDDTDAPGYRLELDLQRYDQQYLYSNFKDGYIAGGRIDYVRLFSAVAIFILLIACINFMNLSTARSLKRAKEIGVRKVIGANRRILIMQFIAEALFLSFLAVIISALVVQLCLPAFNHLTDKEISLPWGNYIFWLELFGLAAASGLLAGIYPAWYISSFDPVKAIKGNLRFRLDAVLFRKGLIVFQFTLSMLLMVLTIVVGRQVEYIQNRNLGFEKDNLLYIPTEGNLAKDYDVFKNDALLLKGIKSVSRMTSEPTSIDSWSTSLNWSGKDPNERPSFAFITVGPDFARTIEGQMVMGRDFSANYAQDSAKFIVNETALRRIGYKDPLNKPLFFAGVKGTIVGVIKDFHFRSLHEAMPPLVIRYGKNIEYGKILVRMEAGKTVAAVRGLEKLCRELNPKFPFTYEFADEAYGKIYASENIIGTLSKYFSALAIAISCMGLLGLVMFSAERRTKEIGIRKVLGASMSSLFGLLSKEFALLIAISFIIAIPLSWGLSRNWLQSFEYRVNLSWWIFLIAGAVTFIIMLFTIGGQVIKSAVSSPVKCLRSE
jgi:ABC-type antimicrobial peptide transport system permease subunit